MSNAADMSLKNWVYKYNIILKESKNMGKIFYR